MRGALGDLPGIGSIEIEAGTQEFKVSYDPAVVDPAKMLAALEEAGEGASTKDG